MKSKKKKKTAPSTNQTIKKMKHNNYHKFLATLLLGTFILQSCSTTTFERNMREETHVYTGTTTMRAQGDFKIKFEEVYASKDKNKALSLGIRYLNNTKFKKANEYMEYSCSVMSKLAPIFEDTEEAYKPWVRYIDVLNKVKGNYVGDSEQFRIFQKNLNHILDGLLLENGKVDINNLDWRIHRKLAGSRKTLPENIAQKISEEKVLENFKIQIDKALDQLIWHEDTDRVNFTRSTLEFLKDYCTEITNEESKNELIQSIISGRLDKYNEEENSGYKFLNHTAILGEDGGLYLLLNSIDKKIRSMLCTTVDPKYLDDKIIKTKSNGSAKVVLGAGGFGKVRFALSLFTAKASPADIICVKKTKNFLDLNANLEVKPFDAVTDYTLSDYFVDEIANLIYAPEVLDMAIISNRDCVSPEHMKGYLMMDVLPQNTGTKIFADAKYQKWEYQKPYILDVFRGVDVLLKKNIAITDLKPDNTLYDVDTRSATIIDVGGSVYAEDLTRFKGSFQCTENFAAPEMISMQKGDIIDLYKAISYMCGRLLEEVTVITDFGGNEIKKLVKNLKIDRLTIENALSILQKVGNDNWKEEVIFAQYVKQLKKRIEINKASLGIRENVEKNISVSKLQVINKDLLQSLDKFFKTTNQIFFIDSDVEDEGAALIQQKFLEYLNSWKPKDPVPIYLNAEVDVDIELRNLDVQLGTNIKNNLPGRPSMVFIGNLHKGSEVLSKCIKTTGSSTLNILISSASKELLKANSSYIPPKFEIVTHSLNSKFDPNNKHISIKRWCIKQGDEERVDYYSKHFDNPALSKFVTSDFMFRIAMEVLSNSKIDFGSNDIVNLIHSNYIDQCMEFKISNLRDHQIKAINLLLGNENSIHDNLLDTAKYLATIFHLSDVTSINEDSSFFKLLGYNRYIPLKYQTIWHVIKALPLSTEIKSSGDKCNLSQSVTIKFTYDSLKDYLFNEYMKRDNDTKNSVAGKNLRFLKNNILEFLKINDIRYLKLVEDFIGNNPDPAIMVELRNLVDNTKHDKSVHAITAAANAIAMLASMGCSFSCQDLSNISIKGADLKNGVFDSTDFTDADLTDVDFTYAYVNGAKFIGCDMTNTKFYFDNHYFIKDGKPIESRIIDPGAKFRPDSGMYSPDGKTIALFNCYNGVQILDSGSGKVIKALDTRLDPRKDRVKLIHYTEDSKKIISYRIRDPREEYNEGSEEIKVYEHYIDTWDIRSGKLLDSFLALKEKAEEYSSMSNKDGFKCFFSIDGKNMAIYIQKTQSIGIIDIFRKKYREFKIPFVPLHFSNSGKYIVLYQQKLLNILTGELIDASYENRNNCNNYHNYIGECRNYTYSQIYNPNLYLNGYKDKDNLGYVYSGNYEQGNYAHIKKYDGPNSFHHSNTFYRYKLCLLSLGHFTETVTDHKIGKYLENKAFNEYSLCLSPNGRKVLLVGALVDLERLNSFRREGLEFSSYIVKEFFYIPMLPPRQMTLPVGALERNMFCYKKNRRDQIDKELLAKLSFDLSKSDFRQAISPDGNYEARASRQKVEIWSRSKGEPKLLHSVNYESFYKHNLLAWELVLCLAYSPCGKYLALGGGSTPATVESIKEQKQYPLAYYIDLCKNISIGMFKIFEIEISHLLHDVIANTIAITKISYSSCGKYLATASDKNIKIWALQGYTCILYNMIGENTLNFSNKIIVDNVINLDAIYQEEFEKCSANFGNVVTRNTNPYKYFNEDQAHYKKYFLKNLDKILSKRELDSDTSLNPKVSYIERAIEEDIVEYEEEPMKSIKKDTDCTIY
jgi:serine/threonine protein kinase